MKTNRAQIEMTQEETHAYLISQRRLILVSNGPNGYPHPVPMNFMIDSSRRIVVSTFRKSQKVKNLLRDPRAALLVESGFTYGELKSVLAYATAQILDSETEVITTMSAMLARAISLGGVKASACEQVLASAPKRVVLRFTPHRYITWDHSKLQNQH